VDADLQDQLRSHYKANISQTSVLPVNCDFLAENCAAQTHQEGHEEHEEFKFVFPS